MKKLLIALGALICLLLAAIVIIPLVVDVDKYRPQIVEAANEHINGKLELGHLKLSLWGQIRVEVEGLSLADSAGRQILAVKDAYFHIPFTSVFAGAPLLTFKMDHPEVHVIKDKTGKLNVMTLMKAAPGTPPSGAPGAPSANTAPAAPTELPAIATRARLGVEMTGALVSYQDATTALTTDVRDLNLVIQDLSLSRETEIELWADLDTRMGKTLAVQGPARLKASAKPEMSGGKFERLTVTGHVDLDGLDIRQGELFHKSKGMAANADLLVTASEREANIENFTIKFFNAEIKVTGTATNLNGGQSPGIAYAAAPPAAATPTSKTGTVAAPSHKAGAPAKTHAAAALAPAHTATPADAAKAALATPRVSQTSGTASGKPAADPIVNLTVKSNEIDFKPWSELVPMLKEYELAGTGQLDASAKGPSSKLDYRVKFTVTNLTAKAGNLKAQPRFDAVLSVITDQVDQLSLTMKAPGNDLRISGKVISFVAPKADFQVLSNGMDLDQLLNFPPPAAKGAPAPGAKPGSAGAPAPAPAADLDALLEPLRENKMLANMQATVNVNMKSIKAKGAVVSDILARLTFRDLTAALEQFSLKVFSSSVSAKLRAQLRPATPLYDFSTTVTGFDIAQAVASQMEMFKNTVTGRADFSMSGEGASFNTDKALAALKAKGSMKIANAQFASIDVGKMVTDALNKAVDKVGDKIPAAKGKHLQGLPGGASKYDLISSDFSIAGNRFSAPNFVAKASPKAGIDLNGDTAVGMKDQSLVAHWTVIDTYNLTHAQDISIEQMGVKIDHILAEKGQPVKFPVSVTGTLAAPVYGYADVPEALAKVALNNITGAAQDRVKSEVKNRAQQAIQQQLPKVLPKNVQVPSGVQNKLNSLFGH